MRTSFAAVVSAGLLIAGAAQAQDKLRVGYMPILPVAQVFVMEGKGWTKEAGLDFEMVRFSDGPAMVQAAASGSLDVMFVGIGPAMVARSKGIPIKVVATAITEQIALVGKGKLVDAFEGAKDPAAAFAAFKAEHGRLAKLATLPKGSVPDTVLRHWLTKVANVPLADVEIVGMGADKVQQALLAGQVDGASILEPVLTVIQERDPEAKVLARSDKMFPGQPGAILAVKEDLIKNRPADVAKLVELHKRATELLVKQPDEAAPLVREYLGARLIPLETVQKALKSPSTNFKADPREIVDGTKRMAAFQREDGSLKEDVPVDELFDTSFYEKVAK